MILDSVFLLLTGVSLNLYAQQLTDTKFARPQSHILATVKFFASLIFAVIAKAQGGGNNAQRAATPRQRRLMSLIGILDAGAYVSFCIGFTLCGASLSSLLLSGAGQIFTACASHFIAKKLTGGQITAVACTFLGLLIRTEPFNSLTPTLTTSQYHGIAYILLAAALYTCLGIFYELLVSPQHGPPPPYPDILWNISIIGAVGASAYQLMWVVPKWSDLVSVPLANSGVPLWKLSALLLVFGSMFNIHMYAQSRVFRSQGALGVGLVNAVRAAAIAVTAGIFMCGPSKPELCLSRRSIASAILTTFGGIIWVLTEARRKRKQRAAENDSQQEKKSK